MTQRYVPNRIASSPVAAPFPAAGQRPQQRAYTRMSFVTAANGPVVDPQAVEAAARQAAFDKAKLEGLEAGRAEGRAQARREAADLLTQLQASVEDVMRVHETLTEGYRRELVEIAFAIADAVLQRQITREPDFAKRLVEQALAALGSDDAFVLTLGPEDADELDPWLHKLEEGGQSISVRRDVALGRGDLRVRTQAGSIESLMSDRLARARALVLGVDASAEPILTEAK